MIRKPAVCTARPDDTSHTILDCRFWIGDCCDSVVMRSDERAHAACSIPIGINQANYPEPAFQPLDQMPFVTHVYGKGK